MNRILNLLAIFFAFSFDLIAQTPVEQATDQCKIEPIMKIFTPNGDGVDDIFQWKTSCVLDSFSFKIFNRWGSSLYSTIEQNFMWNGNDSNQKRVEVGTYFYVLSYSLNGNKKELNGFLNIHY
jgi:gliding motility-associated-like protein